MDRPLEFDLYIAESDRAFQEIDLDETEVHPVEKLFYNAHAATLGGGEDNFAALQKLKPASERRFIEHDGNPWTTIQKAPPVHSQPVESPFEPVDDDALLKSLAASKDLTYTNRRDGNGTLWKEGRDQSGALKSAYIVTE